MKKQLLIIFAIAALLFCVTSTASLAGDKCISWGYKWNTMSDYIYQYAWLYEDGSFLTGGGGIGTWEKFGGSFKLQYNGGCNPIYAGTKKQGFIECTLEGFQTVGDNYYIIKGTSKKNCASITTTEISSAKEGLSGASPE